MESIHCPSSFSPLPSILTNHSSQQRIQLSFLTNNQRRRSPFRSFPLRANALNHAVSMAANSHVGGDISVLLPVSALLLFAYWITNFVVPQVIIKDLQEKASEGKETPEQATNSFNADNVSMPSTSKPKKKASEGKETPEQTANSSNADHASMPSNNPKKKIKKEDVIKMIRPR